MHSLRTSKAAYSGAASGPAQEASLELVEEEKAERGRYNFDLVHHRRQLADMSIAIVTLFLELDRSRALGPGQRL
jgi:hypothetical protein